MSSDQSVAARVLAFAHIGDLHITDAKQKNFGDFLAIAAQIETECAHDIDFVVLPGDNGDNGLPNQYRLIAAGLKILSPVVHIIPGDHDMEQGSLSAFYSGLPAELLPKSLCIRGVRCLFLDVSGPGSGGPDFRLGQKQAAWLKGELQKAGREHEPSIIFMHTYPADIKDGGERLLLNKLFAEHDIVLVDMGHTHYNELANDGRSIFAATRSTGQIEEGPVGYSVATFDNGVVSWRFKSLDEAFPFVIITSPSDWRLMRGPHQAVEKSCEVRALVFGSRLLTQVECRRADGAWQPMRCLDGRVWAAELTLPPTERAAITVRAIDQSGRPGEHTIHAAAPTFRLPHRVRDGSDAASIGAWPENGILGTQLGPNRNAKPFA